MKNSMDDTNTPTLKLAHGYVIVSPTLREQIYWRSGLLYAHAPRLRDRAYNIVRNRAIAMEARFNQHIANIPPTPRAIMSNTAYTLTSGLLLLTWAARKTTKPAQHLLDHLFYLCLPKTNDRLVPPTN